MQILAASESLVLADATADPVRLAADLLNEAEHGPDSATVLVTWQPEVIERVLTFLRLHDAQRTDNRPHARSNDANM